MKKTIAALSIAALIAGCSDGSSSSGATDSGSGSDSPVVYDLEVLDFSFPATSDGDESISLRVRNNSDVPIDVASALADTVFYISYSPQFEAHWWGGANIVRSFYNDTLGQRIIGLDLLPSGHEATMETFADIPEMWDGNYYVKAEINPSRLFRPKIGLTYVRSEPWDNVQQNSDRLFVESDYQNNISGTVSTTVVGPTGGNQTGVCAIQQGVITPTEVDHAINLNVGDQVVSPSCRTGAVLYSVQMIGNVPYELSAGTRTSFMTISDGEGNLIRSVAQGLENYQYTPSYTGAHLFYLYRRAVRDENTVVTINERI